MAEVCVVHRVFISARFLHNDWTKMVITITADCKQNNITIMQKLEKLKLIINRDLQTLKIKFCTAPVNRSPEILLHKW